MYGLKETTIEEKIETLEKAAQELEIAIDNQNRQIADFYAQFGVSLGQVANYASRPDQFSTEQWELMEEERQKLTSKLKIVLEEIQNPKQTIQARSSQGSVRPNWLFVR